MPGQTITRAIRPGHITLLICALACAGCITVRPGTPAPRPGSAIPVAAPGAARAGAMHTTWLPTVSLREHGHAEWLMCFDRLSSKGDIVQPGPAAPGQWDAAYHLNLRTWSGEPVTVSVWASTHNRAPARHVVAQPVFDGVRWKLWVSAKGEYTFTLAYDGSETRPVRGYAAGLPARRWTVWTADFLDMLRWLRARVYLPGVRVVSVTFGFEFTQPVPPGTFTVRKLSYDWHVR